MVAKKGRVYVLGSAASSPHIRDGINASEFEFVALPYFKTTTDAELAPYLDGLRQADFLCAGGDACVDERLLSACPNIKIVSVNGVGYDGVDVEAVTRAGVWLANAPVLREACADIATLLMLAAMRKAAAGYRLCLSAGPPTGWDWDAMRDIVGDDPRGKTLGLIGFGRIGQTFAHKAIAAFGMKVQFYDPIEKPPSRTGGGTAAGGPTTPDWDGGSFGAATPVWVPFETLLSTSDVVSMHASLNAKSRGMMGREQFKEMKPTAYFINMSRGGLVQEEALAAALKAGDIAGAGIDVFEAEPIVHEDLLDPAIADKIFMLPHLASAGDETRVNMTVRMLDNARRALKGEAPLNPLNAPNAAMLALPTPEQHRVQAYIEEEFAYERIQAEEEATTTAMTARL